MKAELPADILHLSVAGFNDAEQQVFRADIVVMHGFGTLLCFADDTNRFRRHGKTALSLNGRNFLQHLFEFGAKHRQIGPAIFKDRCQQAFRVFCKPQHHVNGRNFLIVVECRQLLRFLEYFHSFLCVFFISHSHDLPYLSVQRKECVHIYSSCLFFNYIFYYTYKSQKVK